MRINYLKTKNYRQLKNLSINFTKGVNDLHLIKGKNGIGKTNFLNAINWCLYEDEPHLGKNKNQGLPLANTEELLQLGDGKTINVSVELQIQVDTRTFTFHRNNQFRINIDTESKCTKLDSIFTVSEIVNGNTRIYEQDEANAWVNKIVPIKIRDFFFFDGEQLDKYFYDKTSTNLKGAITEISQIGLLKTIVDRLCICSKDYSSELSRNNPDIERVQQEVNNAQSNFNAAQEELEKVKEEISKAEIRISELNEFLQGQPNVAEEEKKRDSLKLRETEIEKKKYELEQEKSAILRKYILLINFYKPLKYTQDLINKKDSDGTLPPKINKTLLEDTLKSPCCSMCNQQLSQDAIKYINDLLSEIETSDTSSIILLENRNTVNRYLRFSENFAFELDNNHNKELEQENELEEVNTELGKIISKIANLGNAELIKKRHEEREDLELLYRQKLVTKGSLESNLKSCDEKVQNATKTFAKTLEAHSNINKAKKYYKFAEKATKFIDSVQKTVMDEYREKIRKETEEKFLNLVWKKNSFSSVTLDETFTIGLRNTDNMECMSTCSAAERALLALSFTLALHTISGFGKALVIDTPLSRISDENRKKFTEVLLDISKTEQIILLLTPDEYSVDVDKIIGNNYATRNDYQTRSEKESYFGEVQYESR